MTKKIDLIIKSREMWRVYNVAKEKKIITVRHVNAIYTSKQHSQAIIQYLVGNKILKPIGNGKFKYIYDDEDEEKNQNNNDSIQYTSLIDFKVSDKLINIRREIYRYIKDKKRVTITELKNRYDTLPEETFDELIKYMKYRVDICEPEDGVLKLA